MAVAVVGKDEEPEVEPPDPPAVVLNGPTTLALALAKTVSVRSVYMPASDHKTETMCLLLSLTGETT